MNEEENKKVTRRKFLEDSSKKALAGTAAAFLGLGMIKPKAVQAAGCAWCILGCSGGCFSACNFTCSGTCSGSCSGGCSTACEAACSSGCTSTCIVECGLACTNSCDGSCVPSSIALTAECGTPVSEREASTRHVTV